MRSVSMLANVFHSPGVFGVETKPAPQAAPGEAIVRVRLTSICAHDLRIVTGDYPVRPGLTLGHEGAGVIHDLGDGIFGYETGQRVLFSAVTPCGQCECCLSGHCAQCRGQLGGWRLGNTIDGAQAEYVRIPYAQANLALIPETLTDEEVLPLADVASTGFAAAESGRVRLGDNVIVFGLDPVGLCAVLGARLMGAARIYAVDPSPFRRDMARQFGATDLLAEPPAKLCADVAIEATGDPDSFRHALVALKPGGVLSTVGLYSQPLTIDNAAFGAGLSDKSIVTTLCPGGKERMRRLMRLVETGRIHLTSLFTHRFPLARIKAGYDLTGDVLKVAVPVQ